MAGNNNPYEYEYRDERNVNLMTAEIDPLGNRKEYEYDERETITNAYKFHGEYKDEDTGLYYLRARWYDVDTGRFYSMDKFEGVYEEPSSLHKYVFAGNDGVNRVDYSGMYYGIASVGVAIGMAGILAAMPDNVWAGIERKIDFSKDKVVKKIQKVLIVEVWEIYDDWPKGADAVGALISNRSVIWGKSILDVLSQKRQFAGYPYTTGKGSKRIKDILEAINKKRHRLKKYYLRYFKYITKVAYKVRDNTIEDPFKREGKERITLYMWSDASQFEMKNPFKSDKYIYLGTAAGNRFYGDNK